MAVSLRARLLLLLARRRHLRRNALPLVLAARQPLLLVARDAKVEPLLFQEVRLLPAVDAAVLAVARDRIGNRLVALPVEVRVVLRRGES